MVRKRLQFDGGLGFGWPSHQKNKNVRRKFLIISPYLLLIIGGCCCFGADGNVNINIQDDGQVPAANSNLGPQTELTPDPIVTLLLVSTLDGSLTALDRLSGQRRWTTKDEPMIRVPTGFHRDSDAAIKPPFFLPDPRSGSLYVLGGHGQLKKLPFTIPQLVSMAPCRSSEGLLYTGRKTDMWLSLNPLTGEKSEIISFGDSTCPASSTLSTNDKNLLIGKSEYTISMVEGPRKWNVTFHDYSSVEMTADLVEDYELVHFTSPSTGTILTYERDSGQLLWQSELKSPVIALYSMDCKLSTLLSIPFTSVASETLNRIKTPTKARDNSQLSPTLYIGQCPYGLYAVSSLVDDTVLTISSTAPKFPYLIEGPSGSLSGQSAEPKLQKDSNRVDDYRNAPLSNESGDDFVILGHYDIPETAKAPPKQLSSETPSLESNIHRNDSFDKIISPENSKGPDKNIYENQLSHTFPPKPVNTKPLQPVPSSAGVTPKEFPPRIEKSSTFKNEKEKPFLVLTTAIITIAITSTVMSVGFVTFRKFQWKKPPMKYLSGSDGVITVGKISFDPTSVLGKGCEGTFVFKGKFDGRDVAVKRILPECFEFADREVDLLKESDQHANVIRYFCTESDGQFKYIALELCSATLCDWIEGKFVHSGVKPMDVLKEATDGLVYLHSLRIVHRDVKPANVLLTVCPTSSIIRTMISDFGLCKKLANGRVSFSRRSGGIPGTEGWIAPEMMRNTERTTYAVDIFSLGCVYYYVLTNGGHPFGDTFRRQSNIISGEHSFENLENAQGASELIRLMISFNAAERPPIYAIANHPIFWSKEMILAFFLDVSDRIEKENEATCGVLRKLETNSQEIARGDWRDHICGEVAMDLRKYRTYKGHSIRDLLRALRNKKNHYRELTVEAQNSLGQIPDKFVSYWLDRFPALLPHTWEKFESIKSEPIFAKYYCQNFYWTLEDDPETEFETIENIQGSPGQEFEKMSGPDNFSTESPEQPRQKLDKNFWRSKTQQKYNRWKRQIHHNSVHPQQARQDFGFILPPSPRPP